MPTRSSRPLRTRAAALFALCLPLGLAGCATAGGSGTGAAARPPADAAVSADRIRWPADYDPATATFFVHNEIEIAAPPAVVWAELVAAEAWPQWYGGATGVQVRGATDGRLGPDAVFAWRTMGLNFESRIREFAPPYRLSWESPKALIRGYHAWLIVPTPAGCRVVTDEAQYGFLAVMQGIFIPKKLGRLHDEWLAALKQRAEARAAAAP